ncbi:Heat shock protein 89.1 isoform 1 [Hibiscus syriacus]|uniref:Heat shock protein 89.1 isoform 1 n=1 Tax=Hibiscus syriacus TaxID=106335 RepID=A0A6A2X153_HIBSY|nr:Heat shock protein 89.1 isoform 1 [Hibiscus syriacus]
MGTSSGSNMNHQHSAKMLPPRQQLWSGSLQTSLSLDAHEPRSNSDNIHEFPTESASSRETWPAADAITVNEIENVKTENNCLEQSVIRRVSSADKITLRDIARERVDVISEKMQYLPDEYIDELKNQLKAILEGNGGTQNREEFFILQKNVQNDCTCEICANRNGFCNLCTCVICNKFDFEVNTCRWIGCDLCSHSTHTDCATRDGQICTGPSVKSATGPTEMLFRIFRRSDDPRGKKLFWKCEDLLEKTRDGLAESAACSSILVFFQELGMDSPTSLEYVEGGRLIAPQEACNRIADVVQEAIRKMEMVADEKMKLLKKARLSLDACDRELEDEAKEVAELKLERQKKEAADRRAGEDCEA